MEWHACKKHGGGATHKDKEKYHIQYTRELFHVFGDPSMQIYTDRPTKIQIPKVYCTENTIHVEVKDGDARISFYNPLSKQVNTYHGTNASHPKSSNDLIICISRHNYIPYVIDLRNHVYIQNETIRTDRTYWGNIIKVGKNVTNEKSQGNVVIESGSTNLIGEKVELHPGTRIVKGGKLKINNL